MLLFNELLVKQEMTYVADKEGFLCKCVEVFRNVFLVKLSTFNKVMHLFLHLANYCLHQISTPIALYYNMWYFL